MLDKLTWLGHASFRIAGEKVIYIDPWKLKGQKASRAADIILVSHPHYDHYSQEDIDKLRGTGTVIVTVADVAERAEGNVEVVEPGDTIDVAGIGIEAPPAYNVGKDYHPKANGWVGFVVAMGGRHLYYAGDTDVIPEMKDVLDIDVALLPVGGTYTMDARAAAEAAGIIDPGVAVPYHWGDIVGSSDDAYSFASAFKGETVIMQPSDEGL